MPSNPLYLEVEMPANNCTAIKQNMGSSVLEHAIKVRKPYTITKQRERWTKEEHDKFLEALKLYGRAWRQIEEHIRTKTAVQIRSHAQKFFTKVAREMTGDDSGQVKTIEIPPPRPKKKPSHPYPHKLGNSHGNPVMRKQEWSSISNVSLSEQNTLSTPKVSLHEQDNMSPTSVISVVGSDTSGSPASDLMNICTSPVSGSDPAQSVTTSVDDEENSLSQPKSDTELNLGTDDSIRCKEASSMESTASSLKLFGQTVVVTDAQKQNTTDGTRAVQLDGGQTQWNSWSNGVTPMLYLFPSHGNLPDSTEGGVVPMPCIWAPHITTANFSLEQDHLAFRREFLDNGSVESIVGCSFEASIGDSNTNSVRAQSLSSKFRPSETSAFRSLKAPASQPAASKGFVPYRRCVAVSKVTKLPSTTIEKGNSSVCSR